MMPPDEAWTPSEIVKCAGCGAEMPQPWEGSRVALHIESPGEPSLELIVYACQPSCLHEAVTYLERCVRRAYAS